MYVPTLYSLGIILLLLIIGHRMGQDKWSEKTYTLTKIGIVIASVIGICSLAILWYTNLYLPAHAPKPYIALLLETDNQTPLNDILYVWNPSNVTANSFNFY